MVEHRKEPSLNGKDLTDDELKDEIRLLGDVIAAVAGQHAPLSEEQVDEVLGLSEPGTNTGSSQP